MVRGAEHAARLPAAPLAGPPAALPPDSVDIEHADSIAATSRAIGKQLRETAALEVSVLAQAFHAYSLNDVILILSQCNIASCVSGFRKWQDLGRQVRKGEKAVKIFESIT